MTWLVLPIVLLCLLLIGLSFVCGIRYERHFMDENAGIYETPKGRRVHKPIIECVERREYDAMKSEYYIALEQRDMYRRQATGGSPMVVRPRPMTQADRELATLKASYERKFGISYEFSIDGGDEQEVYDMTETETYRKTMRLQHGSGYAASAHQVNVNKVLNYLKVNPTLDESKEPLSFDGATYGPCTQGVPPADYTDKPTAADREAAQRWGGPARGRTNLEKLKVASAKTHAVPFDQLREFIMQHPQLKMIYEGTQPAKTRIKTVKEIIERPLAMTDDERDEMVSALQRQQHIRNEYLRRAYLAVARADDKTRPVYEKELQAQLKGMETLRTFMERLEIPMAEWMNNELALAQLAIIEGKEVTNDLYVRVS